MALSVSINKLGKKFNREWIFRDLTHEIRPGDKLLVSGGNGSGKSTLLQVISGFITPNEGDVTYSLSSGAVAAEQVKDQISFASPYLQLIEEFSLVELVEHVSAYKPFANRLSTEDVIELTGLAASKHKLIRQFSSGMKQRVKLSLAILADTPLLLLDEPVSNLDKTAIAWYRQLIAGRSENRTILVCSNAISDEHFFCTGEINISSYKPQK